MKSRVGSVQLKRVKLHTLLLGPFFRRRLFSSPLLSPHECLVLRACKGKRSSGRSSMPVSTFSQKRLITLVAWERMTSDPTTTISKLACGTSVIIRGSQREGWPAVVEHPETSK